MASANAASLLASGANASVSTPIIPLVQPSGAGVFVQLKTSNGKWICANDDNTVVANSDAAHTRETWFMVPRTEKKNQTKTPVSFLSVRGYLCVDQNQVLAAGQKDINAQETLTFTLCYADRASNIFGLRLASNKLVRADDKNHLVVGRDGKVNQENGDLLDTLTEAETFTARIVLQRPIGFRSLRTGHFLNGQKNGDISTAPNLAGWETWIPQSVGGSSYAFGTWLGKYLSAKSNGSLYGDKDNVDGSWEMFDVQLGFDGGSIAFKTAHNTYLQSHDTKGIVALTGNCGLWESFYVVIPG